MFAKTKKFLNESRQELKHVNWPTRKEGIRLTLIVIGMSVGIALFLGIFDYIFSYLIKTFVI
jgi:preprotein translocase subunit SecE